MSRESGFYWVMYQGEWVIAKWVDIEWAVPDVWIDLDDYDMDEIDENRIERGVK
ncbi:hypothetical protein 4L372X_009 [Aeromonas phage 4_L372X]|nr:hypothetical protein 4L372X_009 [Aeromonas phage 4_L372X]